jgi:hypothetical protein
MAAVSPDRPIELEFLFEFLMELPPASPRMTLGQLRLVIAQLAPSLEAG